MEDVLKTSGIIDSLSNDNHADGLAKSLKAIDTKITTAAGQQNQKATITKGEYDAVTTAVSTIKDSIDEALKAGDLTQLDTANLKALRSSVLDLEKAFTSIEEIKAVAGNNYEVEAADSDKVKAALGKISEASKEEVGESATKALASSKAQAENIGEMRTQLQAFAANPKGATGLESANFTGYLETVDAALSNISDQRV